MQPRLYDRPRLHHNHSISSKDRSNANYLKIKEHLKLSGGEKPIYNARANHFNSFQAKLMQNKTIYAKHQSKNSRNLMVRFQGSNFYGSTDNKHRRQVNQFYDNLPSKAMPNNLASSGRRAKKYNKSWLQVGGVPAELNRMIRLKRIKLQPKKTQGIHLPLAAQKSFHR